MQSDRAYTLVAFALMLLVFAAIAPTLSSHEFSSGMESLNVATAQEIRRTGNWLVPTLQGELRINKPPLEAWLTAAVISDDTMHAISSSDSAARDRGFRQLAWQVRSVALAIACLMLLITFYIGRLLFDAQTGLVSMAVLATSLLFLRFARYATTDLLLSFFVAATILLLLVGILQRRWWIGFVGGGIALALAMMAKGPMALLQSAIPIAIFALWKRHDHVNVSQSRGKIWPPMIVGLIAFIVMGLWWYVIVWHIRPDAMATWQNELTGYEDAAENHASHWYTYFCLIPYMAPWLVFFVAALVVAIIRGSNRERMIVLLLLVPLVLMSFFHDKYPRYILPMLPAAAVLSGKFIADFLRKPRWNSSDKFLAAAHWIMLGVIGIGFPVCAAGVVKELKRVDGQPWFTPGFAACVAIGSSIVILAGIFLQRRFRASLIVTTVIVMLASQAIFIGGYERSPQGVAEYRPLAELIVQSYPDAEIYNAHPRGKRPPPDVGVYANRVLKWVADASSIGTGEKPKVLLMPQNKSDSIPTPPAGWRAIGSAGRSDKWWAFVLEPMSH